MTSEKNCCAGWKTIWAGEKDILTAGEINWVGGKLFWEFWGKYHFGWSAYFF